MNLPVVRPYAARWCVATGLSLLGGGWSAGALAQTPAAGTAAALHAERQAFQAQLRDNAFGEPLVLRSRDSGGRMEGDVFAEISQPFEAMAPALRTASGLCEVLVLHLNVRSCTPSAGELTLVVGPKRAGASGMEHRMSYTLRTEVADASHLRVSLGAREGPLSTRDVRMVFEAVPIDSQRSFVHVGYAYAYGTLARLAMGAYMASAGRDKIGFTVVGRQPDGRPAYVQGERAAIERNAMRYYLALLAHRSVSTGSREEQAIGRLRAWFALTERHAAQLHEYELADYLREKRADATQLLAAR
jgi:hypothetical protein